MSLLMGNICRLCLTRKDTLVPLFNNDNRKQALSLPEKIMNFVPLIKLFVGDGLPAQVCEPCVRLVNISYKFKIQCESSDNTLRQYLNNHPLQDNTNEIFHSVFRTDNPEDCWKLAVKNEVVEVSVEPDTDLEESEDQRVDDLAEREDLWPNEHHDSNKVKEESTEEQQPGPSSKEPNQKPKNSSEKSKNDTKPNKDEKSEVTKISNGSNSCASGLVVPKLKSDAKVGSKTKVSRKKSIVSCVQCEKSFTQKHHLVTHMATHSGEKPYGCTQCDKKFARRRQLTVHMFTHTGEKPFLCPICGDCFGRSDTLTKHMRSHTGEKPFHCAVCGNDFGRRSTLTNHMRAHMGEKPYLCTECGWRFVQSYDLTKHMRSHTGEKPFHCSLCRMSFGQRNSLTKHMRNHTADAYSVDTAKSSQYANYSSHAFNVRKGQNNEVPLSSERLLDTVLSIEKKETESTHVGLHSLLGDKESSNGGWRESFEMLSGSQRWLN